MKREVYQQFPKAIKWISLGTRVKWNLTVNAGEWPHYFSLKTLHWRRDLIPRCIFHVHFLICPSAVQDSSMIGVPIAFRNIVRRKNNFCRYCLFEILDIFCFENWFWNRRRCVKIEQWIRGFVECCCFVFSYNWERGRRWINVAPCTHLSIVVFQMFWFYRRVLSIFLTTACFINTFGFKHDCFDKSM